MTFAPKPPVPSTQPFLTYRPDERVRWGWREVAIGFGVFVLALVLAMIAAAVLPIDRGSDDAVSAFGFIGSIIAYAALTAVIVVAARRRGIGSLAADFGLRFRWIDLAIGLGAGIALRVAFFILAAVVIGISGHVPERGNFELPTGGFWIVLNGFVLATLVAPFVEELFFRGLVLRTVRNRTLRRGGSARRAIVVGITVSAAGFALAHMYQSPDAVFLVILGVSTLMVGAVNGFIAVKTGRLGGAIVTHAVFNGIGIGLALLVA